MQKLSTNLCAAAVAAVVGITLAASAARAEDAAPAGAPSAAQTAAPAATAPAVAEAATQTANQAVNQAANQACPGNPNALGTSRVIAIDPSQLKRVGRMQYPDSLPLNDKEVVLTFDDGPLPPHSNKILDILAAECVKATYFLVGSMARAYPAVVRRIYEEGHTIGTHSENHPMRFGTLPLDRMRHEIDDGIADVGAALGDPKYLAPFFRIPGLERSETAENELAARSLIVFSSDTVADDWHHRITPGQITSLALSRLQARGKGILLLHDIHPTTVAALPGLLKALKDNGFHIVQVVPAPSYLIAMAAKPQTRMLASATPEQLKIGNGIDGGAAKPWPETTDKVTNDIALPAPDASSFEPDSGMPDDSADVHWPTVTETKTSAAEQPAADKNGEAQAKRHADSTRRHERLHAEQPRRHSHSRADADDQPGVLSRIRSFAALFAPAAQPAR